MHYTNRFARTPNVKYIFSHADGSIPYLAARFAIIDEMGSSRAATSGALRLTCSVGFIGTQLLP
jgi:hypothetical protein